MSPRNRLDDWIDEDEYPDDRDVAEFGDDSPSDNHPLTIGHVPGIRSHFWTIRRIILLIIVLLIVAALLLPQLLALRG